MKLSNILIAAVAAIPAYAADADPFEQWVGPKAGDVRGPCPFLNTFANHGFLPRTGKYITEENLTDGLAAAVNFDEGLSKFLFEFAITTNPEPNSTWFSLDHLARHNVLEHDASLSRIDAFFGHAEVFNQEAFDQTVSQWGDTINTETAVDAIMSRLETSKETNPQFSLSDLGEAFLLGETAAIISILGDHEEFTAETSVVEYLFELGWKRRETPFTEENLNEGLETIGNEYTKRMNSTTPSKRGRSFKRRMGHAVVY